MNTIKATIRHLQSSEGISIVHFDVLGEAMRMMALDLDKGLAKGKEVVIGVKATNIALALEKNSGLSISNQLEVTISKIDLGDLLCCVTFTFHNETWESVITRDSALRLDFKVGARVVALVKSSELSIVEVL